MGYRSEIVRVAVLQTEARADEVMAVYAMNELVREHNCAAEWTRTVRKDGVTLLHYHGEHVKWYESYEDVQAMEYMGELLQTFCDERGFAYAWGCANIGETYEDVGCTIISDGPVEEAARELEYLLNDLLEVRRTIHLHIYTSERDAT
jgi:hypothetical protein